MNCYVYKEILCYYDLKVKMTIFIDKGILVIIVNAIIMPAWNMAL